MNTETIEIDGYKVTIAQDEGPENPFEAWDCEPPLLTYYGGRHGYVKAYCDAPETLCEILHMLPAETWERGKRVEFFNEFMSDKFTLREFAEEKHRQGSLFNAVADLLGGEYGERPNYWGAAITWFEFAEAILKFAGVPCLYAQSNGYSQGDTTLCLVVLTPEWFQKSGASHENAADIMQSAVDLYSTWAWGDVYGISSITAPGPIDEYGEETEGEEIEDGSVWGFYGSDHEKSGLLESARESIAYHKRKIAEESENLVAALCSAE